MRFGAVLLAVVIIGAILLCGCVSSSKTTGGTGGATSAPSDRGDLAYLKSAMSANNEIKPVINDLSTSLDRIIATSLNEGEMQKSKELGTKLAARARYWHDTLADAPVSSKFADSKRAYLLALEEYELAGDLHAESMQLYLDGQVSTATTRVEESNNHLSKAAEFMDTSTKMLPY